VTTLHHLAHDVLRVLAILQQPLLLLDLTHQLLYSAILLGLKCLPVGRLLPLLLYLGTRPPALAADLEHHGGVTMLCYREWGDTE
jgi:hypothetical protein